MIFVMIFPFLMDSLNPPPPAPPPPRQPTLWPKSTKHDKKFGLIILNNFKLSFVVVDVVALIFNFH